MVIWGCLNMAFLGFGFSKNIQPDTLMDSQDPRDGKCRVKWQLERGEVGLRELSFYLEGI